MEGRKLLTYILFVAVTQLTVLILYGFIVEDDINTASMYPVVFLLPAIVYNGFSGLPGLLAKSNFYKLLITLLVPFLLSIVGIKYAVADSLQTVFLLIALTSFIVNSVCFVGITLKNRTKYIE